LIIEGGVLGFGRFAWQALYVDDVCPMLDRADTTPAELSMLGDHVGRCNVQRGHLFRVHCAVEAIQAFFAPRFVTMTLVLSICLGAALLLI
jgi:hypothetical protein